MNYQRYMNASQARRTRLARKPTRLPDISASTTRLGSSLKSIAFEVLRGMVGLIHSAGIRVVLAALLVLGAWSLIDDLLSVSVVHMSYTTGQCVKVIDSDGQEGSCGDLPKKYVTHFVQ